MKNNNLRKQAPKRTPYQDYLASGHWRRLRKTKLGKGKNHCSVCTSRERVHIHHMQYRNWYDVRPDDLMRLCAACHKTVHWLMEKGELEITEEMPNEVRFQLILVAVRYARGIVSQGYGQVIYPETKEWAERYLDRLSPIPF